MNERKLHEAYTFLNKKGKGYALNFATDNEKKHFEGILYKNGIPSNVLINFCSYVIIR